MSEGPVILCCVPVAVLESPRVPASKRTCMVCDAPVWVADVNVAALETRPEVVIACLGPCVQKALGASKTVDVHTRFEDLPPAEVLN